MVICKHCGEKNSNDAEFCESCGKELKKDTPKLIPCKDCGKSISKNAEMCPNCGVRLKKTKTEYHITKGITTRKSPSTAAILGVLFGPFGYLYVGRGGLCILWLVIGIILAFATGGFIAPFLWLIWAIHQYKIAKRINEELDGK